MTSWLRALAVTPPLRAAVLVHAVPAGEPWRSSCPDCDTRLPLPGPSARCPNCRERIGPRPYLLEATVLVVAGLVVAAVWGGYGGWAAVALAGWAAVAVPLVFIDLAVHRLPDRLTLPAAGWVLAWLGVAALTGGGAWLRATAAAAACGLGFALFALLPRAMGYGLGDAKLMLSVGALLGWLGWTAVLFGLFLAFLASALVALGLLVTRRIRWRDPVPFGPYLIFGTLVTLVWVGLS